jgi:hypothetical protein
LEKNTSVLKTPLVDIEIIDENGNNILFDLIESTNTCHSICLENDANKIREVTDYAEKIIRINTASLHIGQTYFIKSSKPLEYRSSDEHLFTYGYTEGMQTFAISFPDPNDDEKYFPEHPSNKLIWYDFNCEVNTGTQPVSFYLIDREKEYIYIAAAWIWNIQDYMLDYEGSAEVFTGII